MILTVSSLPKHACSQPCQAPAPSHLDPGNPMVEQNQKSCVLWRKQTHLPACEKEVREESTDQGSEKDIWYCMEILIRIILPGPINLNAVSKKLRPTW